MSNGDEYYSEGNHGGNYSNTYSLWGNSKYYDINNLSPQNYFANARSSVKNDDDDYQASTCDFEMWTGGGPVTNDQDSRNRRIVKKQALFEDPDSFYNKEEPSTSNPEPEQYWTDQYWKKEGQVWGGPTAKNKQPKSTKQLLQKEKRLQEKLNKSLAQPVKMTKAESMMQKMGWQGGALGKTGEGIVEPIVPNVIYATKIGFGLIQPKPTPAMLQKEKKQKLDSKQVFDMNVLLHILEFVKNNNEVELLFDNKLSNSERKRVHTLVNEVLNADDLALVDYSSTGVMELALQISDRNCYVLVTQSEGQRPNRTLCLYKLPPKHVYLIIPDDLREPDDDKPKEQPQEPEEETNPFLQSITRNLKNCTTETAICNESCQHDSRILNKILEFFAEFADKKEFTVFRHLGPFEQEEWDYLDTFMGLASKHLNGEMICEKYLSVFSKTAFEINSDVNGHAVIYKKMGTDEKS